jgi:hypothetical protein
MAAGLGFKTFTTGEVLTAADTNGYLMQGVLVFADAAARTAAITSPQEGQMSYLKDTNSVESYSGSAWVAVGGGTSPINPNLIINGNFTINQRAYVSAANLASGSYGFDRWKSNFTNTTLTFTSAPAGQSVTINSGGGLQQIVEQANVPAGTYTLSFEGTATARIYNSGATPPAYAASPISFTADGLANVVVEFTASGSTKTLSKVKLESGSSATAFSYAGETIQGELANCQRYYWRVGGDNLFQIVGIGGIVESSYTIFGFVNPVSMRAPATSVDFSTLNIYDGSTVININSVTLTNPSKLMSRCNVTPATSPTAGRPWTLFTNNSLSGYLAFNAEL